VSLRSFLKKLLVAFVVLAFSLLGTFAYSIHWANLPPARHRLVGLLKRKLGRDISLGGLEVNAWGRVLLKDVRLRDPAGEVCVSFPRVRVDWRLPLGTRAPFRVHVEGGNLTYRDRNWGSRTVSHPRSPKSSVENTRSGQTDPLARIRLAATGVQRVPESPLIEFDLSGLTATAALTQVAAELPFMQVAGKLEWLRGGALQIHNLQGRLLGSLPMSLQGRVERGAVDLVYELQESSLVDLAAVPPLSFFLVRFGALLEGRLGVRLEGKTRTGGRPKFSGSASLKGASVRIAGQPLVENVEAHWNFQPHQGRGVEGELQILSAGMEVFGLPLKLEQARGRLEVEPGSLRVARMRGKSPFGDLRVGFRARWGQSMGWVLTLDVSGTETGWLQGATVEVTPATMLLQGVQLQGDGMDLVLDARVLPEGIDPPTWRVDEGICVGTAKSRPLRYEGLEGLLYLDNQGGYSFNLEGKRGVVRGQVAANRDLRLWLGDSGGGPLQSIHVPAAPVSGS
jgi:hypothetical protein